jgi:predicted ATPase
MFGKSQHNREQYITGFELPTFRGSAIDQFSSRLFAIRANRGSFDELLREVLNPCPRWTIDQADTGSYFLKFEAVGGSHNSDGLGEGIVSLFFIIDALYDSNPADIIVIDEPELSLHPSFLRKLSRLITRYAKDRQIIIAQALKLQGSFSKTEVPPSHPLVHSLLSTSRLFSAIATTPIFSG